MDRIDSVAQGRAPPSAVPERAATQVELSALRSQLLVNADLGWTTKEYLRA